MSTVSTVPFSSLFDCSGGPNRATDPRPALHAAEVILASDVMSGEEAVVYGRDVLERIVETGEADNVLVLAIAIDSDSDELEWLCALVQGIKGRHDYRSEP